MKKKNVYWATFGPDDDIQRMIILARDEQEATSMIMGCGHEPDCLELTLLADELKNEYEGICMCYGITNATDQLVSRGNA